MVLILEPNAVFVKSLHTPGFHCIILFVYFDSVLRFAVVS